MSVFGGNESVEITHLPKAPWHNNLPFLPHLPAHTGAIPRDRANPVIGRRDQARPASTINQIAARAPAAGLASFISGTRNITMPILENIILKLRPSSGRATDIATALALATSAAADQEIAVNQAKAARDDALLDAEPALLRKAEQSLADAREQGERVAAVLANLTARHTAAVKSEMLSDVAELKAKTEAAEAALSAWWQSKRAELVSTFTKGLALNEAAFNLRNSHQFARVNASQKHPEADLPYPAVPTVDATSWADDLGTSLKWLHSGSREPLKDVRDIARIGDPRPVGSFNLATGGFE